MKRNTLVLRRFLFLVIALMLAVSPYTASASPERQGTGNWWEVTPEPEVPSPLYDSILYSEIAPKLREIEQSSNRVRVEVIGQSAGGRNLFLATISAPEAMGRLGQYQAIRQQMLKDPAKAQEMIEKFGDFKVPVFINASVHGNEYPGVDAAIRLIETLAYENTPEVQAILENMIILVNVVSNPDGRVLGTRQNANRFDINRDMITQSQPEAQAVVRILKEWNPMVTLDLHGFVNPMLIEPCTPPHNPNYEYDLYINWAFRQAEAMEAELFARTGFTAQIPFRDFGLGWDDWAPSYIPIYGMFHGSFGHTLETPYRDARGVDAHYWAVWGALNFIVANRPAMLNDQVEIFRRGFLDLPQMRIPDDYLAWTSFDQYTWLDLVDFPAAYLIPQDAPFQVSDHAPARLVEFLLANDVQVEQASQKFVANGVEYPAGTYVVRMDQPKRGLANTILENGPDLSGNPELQFYSPPVSWSYPLLWGVHRVAVQDPITVKTAPVNKATAPEGSVEGGKAAAYAFAPNTLAAFQVANQLLAEGQTVLRVKSAFTDGGRTFPAGTLLVAGDPALANRLANGSGLDVSALKAMPANAVALRPLKIALLADEGTAWALRKLGFNYTLISAAAFTTGELANYDVLVNYSQSWGGLNAARRAGLQAFFAAGGDYVGLRNNGVSVGLGAGLVTGATATLTGNGIVQVDYTAGDPVAAGYPGDDYAFANTLVYFTSVGPGVNVAAKIDPGNFVVSGFFPGWQTSLARGAPTVVHTASGSTHATLIGLDTTFRGHPEVNFRMIGNALFESID